MDKTHKLDMHTKDKSRENFEKLKALFPNAVTETVKDGKIVHAIDKDILMQEINAEVVEGKDERYQFTWPEKKKAVLLANAPTTKTLRPCRDESVNFDSTKNLYIEGDNLEVLKLLQETYLGKVKMIYIDPPYNTGKDSFVYDDKRTTSAEEYKDMAATDEDGNLVYDFRGNAESNGYFHTDWLNMMYPRLRLARDLLTDDGVIFISIDDHEQENLKKICNEIFGESNKVATLVWDKNHSAQAGIYKVYHEYILCYAKYKKNLSKPCSLHNDIFEAGAMKKVSGRHPAVEFTFPAGTRFEAEDGTCFEGEYGGVEKVIIKKGKMEAKNKQLVEDVTLLAGFTQANQMRQFFYGDKENLFDTHGQKIKEFYFSSTGKIKIVKQRSVETPQTTCKFGSQGSASNELTELFNIEDCPFSSPKPVKMILDFINRFTVDNDIVLDFFSGSATTAHAVMLSNCLGKNNNFILVQLPEDLDDMLTRAQKDAVRTIQSGISFLDSIKKRHTICEIGKERIRRAGKKILQENSLTENDLDIGFRVLKLDTTNMKDVYYAPAQYQRSLLDNLENNIKEDRSPEDLLFQVLLDLGVELSGTIASESIGGKTVFNVENNYCTACFDTDLTDTVITEIAKKQPVYAVFRDMSFNSDSVGANVEQIFKTYSPNTKITVL